jgi:hypothetical protein
MSIREKEKQKTNQRLKEALQRLIDKVPTERELKRRDKVKVNALTVQQEAGVSVGAIRHHPDVGILIKEYQQKEKGKGKPTQTTPVELGADFAKLQLKIEVQAQRIEKLKNNLATEKKLKEEYRAKAEYLGKINQELLEEEHQLMQALLNKVPLEDRHSLFKKHESGLNVVSINSNKNGT